MSQIIYRCATLALCGLIAGCSSSRPTNYYVLEVSRPLRPFNAQKPEDSALVVGVTPVRVPSYLDRYEIVTRTANHQVVISDFDSWAESLESSVTRSLAVMLDNDPRIAGSVILPTLAEVKLDRVVLVELVRFDGVLGGPVRLTARILLLDAERKPIQDPVWFDKTHESTAVSYIALIDSMANLLGQLNQQVVDAIAAS